MLEKVEDDESPGRGSKLGMLTAVAVGLPLLYLLSTGPVVLILEKTNGFGGMVSLDILDKVYYPVVWLYNNTFMRDPIEMYLKLWGVK
jgi:hypothetical protein